MNRDREECGMLRRAGWRRMGKQQVEGKQYTRYVRSNKERTAGENAGRVPVQESTWDVSIQANSIFSSKQVRSVEGAVQTSSATNTTFCEEGVSKRSNLRLSAL